MKMPSMFKGESITRLVQGTIFGAIVAIIVGFNWGGWMLESNAATQAKASTTSTVVELLSPLCVTNFQNAEEFDNNLVELKKLQSYKRKAFIEEGSWANLPGADEAYEGVVKACVAKLIELKAATTTS